MYPYPACRYADGKARRPAPITDWANTATLQSIEPKLQGNEAGMDNLHFAVNVCLNYIENLTGTEICEFPNLI